MKIKSLFAILLVFLLIFYSSCTCYNVKINDLRGQFANIDSSQLTTVEIQGFYGDAYTYLANQVDYIRCFDNHNNAINIENSPSTELKIIEKNHKSSTFYLDRVFIKDSIIYGYESRMYPKLKSIHFDNIKRIKCSVGKAIFTQQK